MSPYSNLFKGRRNDFANSSAIDYGKGVYMKSVDQHFPNENEDAYTPLLTDCELIGGSDQDLVNFLRQELKIRRQVVEPLQQLMMKAADQGFDMRIASGFRSFDRQLLIWNNKAQGNRPVLDENGCPIDLTFLTEDEKMWAILKWSALPGASRHHWGTDVDVYDASKMSETYELQLTQEETEGEGPCAEFHAWLTRELREGNTGFYRPFTEGIGKVSPEPWHLSFAPLANQFAEQLTEDILRKKLQATDIALKQSVLKHLHSIFEEYIKPYQL